MEINLSQSQYRYISQHEPVTDEEYELQLQSNWYLVQE